MTAKDIADVAFTGVRMMTYHLNRNKNMNQVKM